MLTRQEAIEIAQQYTLETEETYEYLPDTPESAKHWQPPEWVISAIVDAYYKGYEG